MIMCTISGNTYICTESDAIHCIHEIPISYSIRLICHDGDATAKTLMEIIDWSLFLSRKRVESTSLLFLFYCVYSNIQKRPIQGFKGQSRVQKNSFQFFNLYFWIYYLTYLPRTFAEAAFSRTLQHTLRNILDSVLRSFCFVFKQEMCWINQPPLVQFAPKHTNKPDPRV